MNFMKQTAATLVLATALGAASPAMAMPRLSQPAQVETQKAEQVRHWKRRYWRHDRRGDRWRHVAPGIAGIIIGGAIANAVRPRVYYPAPRVYVAPRPVYRGLPAAHLRWCDRRYRSYRATDNTFQPYHGPRRACVSPYLP